MTCLVLALLLPILWSTPSAAQQRRQRQGALALKCSVAGATVTVDGLVVGKTPMRQLALSSGRHEIRISKDGHTPFFRAITVRGGRTVRLRVTLDRAAKEDPDDLQLEGVTQGGAGDDDELRLEGVPGESDDLELEAVGADTELELESAAGGPDLELEQVAPAAGSGAMGIVGVTTVAPLVPWWQRWYSIAGAATAVVVLLTAVVVVSRPCTSDFGIIAGTQSSGIKYSCGLSPYDGEELEEL